MTIQELMEKRAKVWEAAKNFVDTHENENGVLSAEDSAAYERMEAEIEDLTKAIDRHRKAEEMEKSLNQPVNQPLTGKPYAGGQGESKTGRCPMQHQCRFRGPYHCPWMPTGSRRIFMQMALRIM